MKSMISVIGRRCFVPVTSFIACSRSSEPDWTWVDSAFPWYLYWIYSGRVHNVPERRSMLARQSAVGSSILGIEGDPTRVLRCGGRAFFGFKRSSIMVYDSYSAANDFVAPVAAGSETWGLVENDNDLKLREIQLSRKEGRASLHFDFTAIQMQCRKLNIVGTNKAGDVLDLAPKMS